MKSTRNLPDFDVTLAKVANNFKLGISNIPLSRAYHALTFFVFCCVIGTDHPKGGRIAITSTYT